ncbi:Mu-like prophage protein gp36 [Tistlia consotensis]|uniref:Mu-like prophage protein gp36 n=1 Tax=Tistlia consotensis USBA 355 TaxID=560819 RepID=A0A1Y6CRD6_9PROT|nr:DUF1320 domain-containing protein [Tistlia consotensis]SMF83043.1 Mu-like prophage protein gp36 [Tistlia consotensis USBA 355]SNS31883.1 Mu-like prophage protein gp36 [Tistlia consotensis]
MAYATLQNLIDRYGSDNVLQVADRDGDGQADTATVDRELAAVSAEIDGYLALKYDLPLSATPDLVQDLCERLVFFRLHVFTAPDQVAESARQALATLDRLSKGLVVLELDGEPAAAAPDGPRVSAPDRVFSRDTLEGY